MLDVKTRTFLAVCQYMNYTRAAQALNMTQPGVSQHIRSLEAFYGVKLFSYERRNLTLTAAGVQIRDALLTMQHDTQLLCERVQQDDPAQETWRFGATKSIGEFLLPELLGNCLARRPQLKLECRVENTQTLLEQLNLGVIDFALIEGNYAKREYESIQICCQKLMAVCSAGLKMEANDISDLFSVPLIVREPGSGTREVLEHYLQEHGFDLGAFQAVSTVSSPGMIKQILAYTHCVSFLYETVVREELDKGTLREIKIPGLDIVHEFNFIWQRNSLFCENYKSIYRELFRPERVI